MRRECYRCRCSLGPDVPDPLSWDRATQGEPVTSGLCETCMALERERWDAELAEIEDPGDAPGTW